MVCLGIQLLQVRFIFFPIVNFPTRRLSLYKLALNESLNFDDFFIAIGGRGGLIAFLQRPKQTGKSLLLITTAAGHTYAETLVRLTCRILLCILS